MLSFSIFEEDPVYRLLKKLGLSDKSGNPKLGLVSVILVLFTWCPTALLAFIQDVAIRQPAEFAFLYDFAAYSQFVVGIPLLVLSEPYINKKLKLGLEYFITSGIIPPSEYSVFEEQIRIARKAESSVVMSILLLVFSLLVIPLAYIPVELTNGVGNWHALVTTGTQEVMTWAGWWNILIALPIVTYLFARWIWKIMVWYWLLWQISKMNLYLHASHPDRFGGLGFLASLQSRFGFLIFANGLSIAATMTYKLLVEKSPFNTFTVAGLAVIYLTLAPVIFLIPLFFFRNLLSTIKQDCLLQYSSLAAHCIIKIETLIQTSKNIESDNKVKHAIDNLASINTYYENINKMHVVPMDFQKTSRLFISALGPLIPLFIQSFIFTGLYESLKQAFIR
jgi:hypothetical protein